MRTLAPEAGGKPRRPFLLRQVGIPRANHEDDFVRIPVFDGLQGCLGTGLFARQRARTKSACRKKIRNPSHALPFLFIPFVDVFKGV